MSALAWLSKEWMHKLCPSTLLARTLIRPTHISFLCPPGTGLLYKLAGGNQFPVNRQSDDIDTTCQSTTCFVALWLYRWKVLPIKEYATSSSTQVKIDGPVTGLSTRYNGPVTGLLRARINNKNNGTVTGFQAVKCRYIEGSKNGAVRAQELLPV